jgi:hypothetical protein
VVLGMMLRRCMTMLDSMNAVPVSQVRVMSCLLVIARLIMLSGFLVVMRRMLVMRGRTFVTFGAFMRSAHCHLLY